MKTCVVCGKPTPKIKNSSKFRRTCSEECRLKNIKNGYWHRGFPKQSREEEQFMNSSIADAILRR